LVEYYKASLGAVQVGTSQRMVIENPSAQQLVDRYFEEMDQWP
jgi:hypothetical protein